MGLIEYFRRLTQYSRHEKHISHTKEPSKSRTDKPYRSHVPNNGPSRNPPQNTQHAKNPELSKISERRDGNSRQPNHVYKPYDSVKEEIKYIGKHIDRWNKKYSHQAPIKIDIIILAGLLNIDRNSTAPRSNSPIRFICKSEKHWKDLYTEELRSACKKLKWHTGDQWRPYDLDLDVRKTLFKANAEDDVVYTSGEGGMTIRRPPLEYRICQRIDLLRNYESKSEHDFKLKEIVSDIKKYIRSRKGQFEDIRPEPKNSIITPRDLIEKWQKEYHFEFRDVLRWLKNDVQSYRVSHEEGKHGRATKKRVERSKLRDHSGTESHESRKVNRPYDSVISSHTTDERAQSIPRARKSSKYGSDSGTSTSKRQRRINKPYDPALSPSGTNQRAPSKSHKYEPSHYDSNSDTSTYTYVRRVNKSQDSAVFLTGTSRRAPSTPRAREPSDYGSESDASLYQRQQARSRSPVRRKPRNNPKHDAPTKTPDHLRPLLITTDSSPIGHNRRRPPGKSAHRGESPKRTLRTPQTPLRPSPQPSNHGHQKSPARPGSSGRQVTRESSHPDLLNPHASQLQSHYYPQMSQFQQHSNSELYSPTTRNRGDRSPKLFYQNPPAVSTPVSPLSSPLKVEGELWENIPPDERARHHKKLAEER